MYIIKGVAKLLQHPFYDMLFFCDFLLMCKKYKKGNPIKIKCIVLSKVHKTNVMFL